VGISRLLIGVEHEFAGEVRETIAVITWPFRMNLFKISSWLER